jgi:putative transposase
VGQAISFKRHRFPTDVIRQAVWLYSRFTLSIRDVEELLAQRGVDVSREAVRCWVNKFGSLIAANLRRRRELPPAAGIWMYWGISDGVTVSR